MNANQCWTGGDDGIRLLIRACGARSRKGSGRYRRLPRRRFSAIIRCIPTIAGLNVAREKIRFTITSADLQTAYSCDCQKWIRHLASHGLKTDDLHRLFSGKFPTGKLFVLDMLEYLRKTDPHLDRFLAGRGGIRQDDHLSIDYTAVRQLLGREFPELVARLAEGEQTRKVIKRRPGTVDLSPLTKKR